MKEKMMMKSKKCKVVDMAMGPKMEKMMGAKMGGEAGKPMKKMGGMKK